MPEGGVANNKHDLKRFVFGYFKTPASYLGITLKKHNILDWRRWAIVYNWILQSPNSSPRKLHVSQRAR